MELRERVLYHQIHPLKLLTDVTTSVIATWLLWRHEWPLALVVGFVPSVVVSGILIGVGRLDRYRASAPGRYVARCMTRSMEAVRFAGLAVAWLGAWYHVGWLIPTGVVVILSAWLRGWLVEFGGGVKLVAALVLGLGAILTASCVLVEGKGYWAWAVPPPPPSPSTVRCEAMSEGSGSLIRVRAVDVDGNPFPGASVRVRERSAEVPRLLTTDVEGTADAWTSSGDWIVEAGLPNFSPGTRALTVASEQMCEVTFSLRLIKTSD